MIRLLLRSLSAATVLILSASFTFAEGPPAAPSLPLSFEQNKGQVAGQYPFLFRHNGTEALFLPEGVDLQLTGSKRRAGSHLGLRLLHESSGVEIHPELQLIGQTNYLLGADAAHYIRGVPTFSRLRYRAVYPGIDLVFYGNGSHLEYDFRVAPGADARPIAFRLEGAEVLESSATGDLRVKIGDDVLVLQRPFAYQESSYGRIRVRASFTVARDGAIEFELGDYDHTRELVIDPALTYATYLDKFPVGVTRVATDSTGATYITGYTFFSSYDVTPGVFQATCAACANNKPVAYITKLDPTGTNVLYSTFLGGSDYAQPFALAVDASGNAIIGGYTVATDFPVKNSLAVGTLKPNGRYGFISSISPNGSALNFSTLLNGNALVSGIAVGTSNNIFFTGQTDSPTFPVSAGALNALTPRYPNQAAFVTQLTPAGALVFSALLGNVEPQNGGAGLIGVQGIAVDEKGEAYITGAAGTLWPVTPAAYQTTIPDTNPYSAPFVTKLAADGSHLLFSTFFGFGIGQSVALEEDGTVDLLSSTGESSSAYTAYLSRISPDGQQVLQSTTLGSGSRFAASTPTTLVRDSSGNLWVAGSTLDPSYPLLHPVQGIGPRSSSPSGFLSEYDPSATTLKFSTFFDGINGGLTGLAIDTNGVVHLTGTTVDPIYTSPDALVSSVTPPPPNVDYAYGYLALVNPSMPSSAVCAPADLSNSSFSQTPVGIASSIPLKVTNCGELPLSLTSVQPSSSVFTVQDPAAACGSSLASGASCTIQVSFLPTQSGRVNGTLTLLSNASVPKATIFVSGTGVPPPPNLSNTLLTFTTSPGVASASQTVNVTNVSDIPLTFYSISVSEPFSETDTCPLQLAPAGVCTVTVGFTSTAAGTFRGFLLLADSAFNQSQAVTLTGIATVPSLSITSATPAAFTQTVIAGQPATFALSATSFGSFAGTAAFSCTNLPQYAACSFAPPSLTLSAGSSDPVSLTITTRQSTTAVLRVIPTELGGLLTLAFLGLPLLCISHRHTSSLARVRLLMLGFIAFGISLSTLILGCSGSPGSGSSPSQSKSEVTPSGTYTINVVVTTASATVSAPVTLVVQ